MSYEEVVSTMMDISSRIAKGGPFTNTEYWLFWLLVEDAEIDGMDRVRALRPLVFTDYDKINGRAQHAYEDVVAIDMDRDENDPLLAEFYDWFEVGDDGLCKAERDYIAAQQNI